MQPGGADFVNLLITKDGQAILTADGQTPISPAVASRDRTLRSDPPEREEDLNNLFFSMKRAPPSSSAHASVHRGALIS
ncbi:MAG: hypothetical protein MZV70_30745 [Desulfobacterales bacterium]|nr:hypothetical protein [Desulfobacterales bacterium]